MNRPCVPPRTDDGCVDAAVDAAYGMQMTVEDWKSTTRRSRPDRPFSPVTGTAGASPPSPAGRSGGTARKPANEPGRGRRLFRHGPCSDGVRSVRVGRRPVMAPVTGLDRGRKGPTWYRPEEREQRGSGSAAHAVLGPGAARAAEATSILHGT